MKSINEMNLGSIIRVEEDRDIRLKDLDDLEDENNRSGKKCNSTKCEILDPESNRDFFIN